MIVSLSHIEREFNGFRTYHYQSLYQSAAATHNAPGILPSLGIRSFLVSTSSKNALRSSDREGNKIYAIPNREYAPLRLSKENYIKFDNKPKLWSVVSSIFYSR